MRPILLATCLATTAAFTACERHSPNSTAYFWEVHAKKSEVRPALPEKSEEKAPQPSATPDYQPKKFIGG